MKGTFAFASTPHPNLQVHTSDALLELAPMFAARCPQLCIPKVLSSIIFSSRHFITAQHVPEGNCIEKRGWMYCELCSVDGENEAGLG